MKPSKKCKSAGPQSLADYITDYYDGNQSAFARSINPPVQRAQVNQWLKAGYVVIDGKLCAVRRDLGDALLTPANTWEPRMPIGTHLKDV